MVTVESTADGGAHWARTPLLRVDGQAMHIQFVDAQHGWVFAGPSAGGALGSHDTTLYRTVDGGASWQAMKPPSEVRGDADVRGSLPEPCTAGGTLGSPSFLDSSNGWVGAACDRMFFYATHDGGLTWSAQNLPPFPGPPDAGAAVLYGIDPPQFVSSRDGVAFVHRGGTSTADTAQDAAMYSTHDGGQTWSAVRLPAAERAAAFLDASHGWMTAVASPNRTVPVLFATNDGGLSWSMLGAPLDFLRGVISFIDTTTGFVAPSSSAAPDLPAAASDTLLETKDGGASWTPVAATFG